MKRIILLISTMIMLCLAAGGCVSQGGEESEFKPETIQSAEHNRNISEKLHYLDSVDIKYASLFSIDKYEEGCSLITIDEEGRYLLVPKELEIPDDLPLDIKVLYAPVDKIYLAASACTDMFARAGALKNIGFSSFKASDCVIDEARFKIESGEIAFSGKYNAPDYELLLSNGCKLAVENTMINHSPKIKEELTNIGIPVLIDHSSYEEHPLGRCEWVKLYGALTGHEEDALKAFDEQADIYNAASAASTNSKVAFFYITSDGRVNVRKPSDYMAKLIEHAGGSYVPEQVDGENENVMSTISMSVEDFFVAAKDCDYIIYNSTIEGEIATIEALVEKCGVLADFKAVKDGNVYCCTKNIYQSSMEPGIIASDIKAMLEGRADMKYMSKCR